MRAPDLFALRQQLDARQLAVLEDLRRFRLLSAGQIQRLHFGEPEAHRTSMGAARATNRVLNRLRDMRLISPLRRRVGGEEQGSTPTIWQLTEGGAAVLHLGSAPLKRSRFGEPTSALFVEHTIATAEAAIQIKEFARRSGLEVLSIQTEPECWRSFFGENGQSESLRPDLYVVLADETFEQHAFVEIDLATEHGPQILRKCRLYSRYTSSGSAQRDNGVIPRVIWVAPHAARAQSLKRFIAADQHLSTEQFEVVYEDVPRTIAAGLLAEPRA